MKRTIFYLMINIILSVFTAGLISCKDFLEENPIEFTNPETFFNNKNQCIASLNGCYIPLNKVYGGVNILLATELCSDLATQQSTLPEVAFSISPSNPGASATTWTQCYQGIMYCNNTIAGIEKSKLSYSEKLPLIAEAVTLRAFYYYVLTCTFGDVPYYTFEVNTSDDISKATKIPRINANAIRNTLINELSNYAPNMTFKFDLSDIASKQRANADLAYMLIGKMAMWNKNWSVAIQALKKIEEKYGEFSQENYPLEQVCFRNQNIKESLFEIQFLYTGSGKSNNKTHSLARYMTPKKSSGDVYAGVHLPEIGDKANTEDYPALSTYELSRLYDTISVQMPFINGISGKRKSDPRRDSTLAIRRGGSGQSFSATYRTKEFVVNGRITKKYYFGPKFWRMNMVTTQDGNNIKIFRYADVILMLAECYNELNSPQKALYYLRQIRKRAGYVSFFEDMHVVNQESVRKEIQDERARELAGEFQRKWDLVRWGIYSEKVTNALLPYNEIEAPIDPKLSYFPISTIEIMKSGGVLVNDEGW